MAQKVLENLKYTKEHEWVKVEGDTALVGITDFAQSSLGDIVFVELPEIGKKLNANQTFGVVESIKSVSDLYSPLSGTVLESNTALTNSPETCNQSPYENAWMLKLKIENPGELNDLLSATQYSEYLSNL